MVWMVIGDEEVSSGHIEFKMCISQTSGWRQSINV